MNKFFATVAAALLCCTFNAYTQESAEPAQLDLEPGIYAIVDGQATDKLVLVLIPYHLSDTDLTPVLQALEGSGIEVRTHEELR